MANRGRPKLYTGKKFEKIAEMIRDMGALKTTQVLRARADAEIAALRDKRVFPNASPISFPTVLRIAKDAGITLSVGRRPSNVKVAETETVATPTVDVPAEAVAV